MASFGSPEQFMVGSLASRLGQMLPGAIGGLGSSLASALASGGGAANGYLQGAGGGGFAPQGPNTFMPTFEFDGGDIGAGGPGAAYGQQAGAGATTGKVDPRQALVMQRAMEDAENRRAIIAYRKAASLAPNTAPYNNSYWSGRNDLTDTFNSASGPYGQLQMALAMMAPSRSAERIAAIEAQTAREANRERSVTANRLVDAILDGGISGGRGVPLTGVGTDYGAGVRLSPIFMRSDLSRYRRGPRAR